jgi:hypothetical protein
MKNTFDLKTATVSSLLIEFRVALGRAENFSLGLRAIVRADATIPASTDAASRQASMVAIMKDLTDTEWNSCQRLIRRAVTDSGFLFPAGQMKRYPNTGVYEFPLDLSMAPAKAEPEAPAKAEPEAPATTTPSNGQPKQVQPVRLSVADVCKPVRDAMVPNGLNLPDVIRELAKGLSKETLATLAREFDAMAKASKPKATRKPRKASKGIPIDSAAPVAVPKGTKATPEHKTDAEKTARRLRA